MIREFGEVVLLRLLPGIIPRKLENTGMA